MSVFRRLVLLMTVACPVHSVASVFRSRLAVDEDGDDAAGSCGSMYVVVFSRRDAPERRQLIRKMWKDVGTDFGNVASEFVLCQPLAGEDPTVNAAIASEQQMYGDVRVMDCKEGYVNGLLTKKVEASLNVFLDEFADYDYFMKIDDDTFASFRRICNLLNSRAQHDMDNSRLYAGVFAEGKETMDTKHTPCRNQSSEWYEPESNFPGDVYPRSAKGGPGYILSGAIAREIVLSGTSQHVLNNEDKAVGVWVDSLVQKGQDISLLNIPGTDGYAEHKKWTVTSGTYGNYPHFLHHHLDGTTIACLHEIDTKLDPTLIIDGCFNAS